MNQCNSRADFEIMREKNLIYCDFRYFRFSEEFKPLKWAKYRKEPAIFARGVAGLRWSLLGNDRSEAEKQVVRGTTGLLRPKWNEDLGRANKKGYPNKG